MRRLYLKVTLSAHERHYNRFALKQLRFFINANVIAGSLEAAYSLNWGAREIWGKGGGETLALLW